MLQWHCEYQNRRIHPGQVVSSVTAVCCLICRPSHRRSTPSFTTTSLAAGVAEPVVSRGRSQSRLKGQLYGTLRACESVRVAAPYVPGRCMNLVDTVTQSGLTSAWGTQMTSETFTPNGTLPGGLCCVQSLARGPIASDEIGACWQCRTMEVVRRPQFRESAPHRVGTLAEFSFRGFRVDRDPTVVLGWAAGEGRG